jgi:hypothetical protein
MRSQRVLRTAAQILRFYLDRAEFVIQYLHSRKGFERTSAVHWEILGQGELAAVSWVIPDGKYSDHPINSGQGPAWVAAIVNAIGNSTTCDNNIGYWQDTAIFITWDDRGGWFDHVAPVILKDTRKYQDQ